MTPRCDGCVFFAPPAVAVPGGLGDCRRLPPVVVVVEAMSTEYPLVRADGWCGEHRPIGPDAKPEWDRLWEKPETPAHPPDQVRPGPVEFHCGFNPSFRDRFFAVADDLRNSGSIADIWLWDIAAVLAEFGYTMTITRTPEKQAAWEAAEKARSHGHHMAVT